jgi:hypothetical protein
MKIIIKKILNKLGYQIISNKIINNPTLSTKTSGLGYISATETVKNARESGLSICDYVEKIWDNVGDTQKVIDNMKNYNVFQDTKTICEIGAGTGRYMEKVISVCKPERYESYETANDWADYLQKNYPIISCITNGKDLNETKDNSIDLLHAHGVFVYLPFLVSIQYFLEISRVVNKNGFVVFDVISEDCMNNEIVNKWIKSENTYPCFLSSEYVDNFFISNNFKKIGCFFNNYGEGKSKYLVYKKL